ncbi:MAG: arylformamidase [Thermoplasmata archaeon]|jgi:arylformamidase|nr:arylformamidase [Thermoplasmata archaeon]
MSAPIRLQLSDDEAAVLWDLIMESSEEDQRILRRVAGELEPHVLEGDDEPEAAPAQDPEGILDISPLVSPRIAVWPGDVPYTSRKSATLGPAGGIDLGDMHTTYHVGAHTDAPRHYKLGAADAASVPLEPYVGPCQVVQVRARRGKRFGLVDLAQQVTAPRVLFKTGTFPDPHAWNTDFAAPEPELLDALAARGVVLVGFDTPSTDLFDSKDLAAHQRLAKHGMMNLEGLVLDHVAPGDYTLVALPLKLQDADASPVRAVLLPP